MAPATFRLFDVMAADYHIFEGLTIRNTDVAFLGRLKDVLGPKGLTVRNCRIENVGIGSTRSTRSKDFYIADNVFLGRDDPLPRSGLGSPDIYGAHELTELLRGQGLRFGPRDLPQRGRVLSRWHRRQHARHSGDGAGSEGRRDRHLQQRHSRDRRRFHRVRWRRAQYPRDAKSRHQRRAYRASAQPVFGGPVYFIRNVVYNAPTALKFMAKPAGSVVYHNTIISENRNTQTFSNAHFRNNLFLGTDAPGRAISAFPNATSYSTYDYDGLPAQPRRLRPVHLDRSKKGELRDYDAGAAGGGTLQDARGFGRRHRAGDARHRGGLRHLRERAAARSGDASCGLPRWRASISV